MIVATRLPPGGSPKEEGIAVDAQGDAKPCGDTQRAWRRLAKRFRWHICCAIVVGITYGAVYLALQLPRSLVGANFIFTAFPAAMAQFVVIDFTKNGVRRRV